MKHNISTIDRIIRILIAIIFSILFFAEILTGMLGIVSLIVAAIALVTGLTKFCFMYAIFGIKTCKEKDCE